MQERNGTMSERFTVGQWVRIQPTEATLYTEHVGKIAVSSSPRNEPEVLFLIDIEGKTGVHAARLLAKAEHLKKWAPREGERVRVTKCDPYPEVIGLVVHYERGGTHHKFTRANGAERDTRAVPVDQVEFDPAFDEPTPEVRGESDYERPKRSVETRALGSLPLLTFNGIEIPSPPLIGVAPCGKWLNEAPLKKHGVRVAKEKTHPTLRPKADRYTARKAMALEVLSQPWKGRNDGH